MALKRTGKGFKGGGGGPPQRRGQMTLERLQEICRIFGLRQFPFVIPFSTEVGLAFPNRPLTSYEIRVIGAGAAGRTKDNASWYIGDLLGYLQTHRDAPMSFDAVASRCRRAGLKQQSLANYKSVARSFPFAERHPGVPWVMHSEARTLRQSQRNRLLARAAIEHPTPKEFRIWVKETRGATRSEIIVAKLESELPHLDSARPDRNEVVQAIDRCIALLTELREIAACKAH